MGRALQSKAQIDMAQWGGLIPANARNSAELEGILKLGAVGMKAFMSPSGMDDFPAVDRSDIEAALPALMRHRKPLMLHAEVLSATDNVCNAGCDARKHQSWEQTRPAAFEVKAAREIVKALRNVRSRYPTEWANATLQGSAFGVHIAHVASADVLPVYQEVCSLSKLRCRIPWRFRL
jgi:allantoinase